MNTLLWVAAVLVALTLLAAGLDKLVTPFERLRVKRTWARDLDAWQARGLGLLEVLGAIGLIVPAATDIAPALVPLAAACIAMLMVGVLVVEGRQHRSATGLALPTATLLLALLVAVGRAGPYRF